MNICSVLWWSFSSFLPVFAVGVCMVHHPERFLPSAALLDLLLVCSPKWFQRVQLVSSLAATYCFLFQGAQFLFEVFFFCMSKQGSWGRASLRNSFSDVNLTFPGWCTTVLGNGGTRRCPSSLLRLWDSPTLHSWWLGFVSVPLRMKCYQNTSVASNKQQIVPLLLFFSRS